jgi:hypothetical protein
MNRYRFLPYSWLFRRLLLTVLVTAAARSMATDGTQLTGIGAVQQGTGGAKAIELASEKTKTAR